MPIDFKCPKCGQPLIVKESMTGRKAKCPKCKTVLTLPAGDEPSDQAPQPAPTAEGKRQIGCPKCGQPLIVKDAMLGKKARCPKCKAVVQMPAAEEPAAEAPAVPGKCCSCGKPLEADAVFCVECGTDQRTGESVDVGAQPEASSSEKSYEEQPSSPPVTEGSTVPKAVGVCGSIIRAYCSVIIASHLVGGVVGAVMSGSTSLLIAGVGSCVIPFIFFRLGTGLRRGERVAVYGSCMLAGLTLIGAFAAVALLVGDVLDGTLAAVAAVQAVVFALMSIVCAVAIVSAFRHWDAFNGGSGTKPPRRDRATSVSPAVAYWGMRVGAAVVVVALIYGAYRIVQGFRRSVAQEHTAAELMIFADKDDVHIVYALKPENFQYVVSSALHGKGKQKKGAQRMLHEALAEPFLAQWDRLYTEASAEERRELAGILAGIDRADLKDKALALVKELPKREAAK